MAWLPVATSPGAAQAPSPYPFAPTEEITVDELEEKIARLPTWARSYIEQLRKAADPNNDELRAARKKLEEAQARVRRVEARIDAMMEIFQAAGRGGSETAAAYVERVAASYDQE